MRILLVEDSKFFSKAVAQGLTQKLDAQVSAAYSRAEALELLKDVSNKFDFALVDIVLPDSDQGEVVEDVLSCGIPTIVFTGGISPDLRERLINKPIIDYVLKNSPSSLSYLFNLMERLIKNTTTEILIVDDSRSYRLFVKQLLEKYRLTVHEADGAEAALKVLASNSQIQLALIDHNMPKVTGVELIKQIRKTYGPEDLGIIGLSSSTNPDLSIQFIKYGANDFLPKDFRHEELFCRVSQNLNMLDMLRQLSNSAKTDQLTGLSNRKHVLEKGAEFLAKTDSALAAPTVAVIDLDDFKQVNETYGYDVGDIVLQNVADVLSGHCSEGEIFGRIGGEEFAVITNSLTTESAGTYFDQLRQKISEIEVVSVGQRVPVSCTIGVANKPANNLDAIIKRCDELLFNAEDEDGNRVRFCEAYSPPAAARLAS